MSVTQFQILDKKKKSFTNLAHKSDFSLKQYGQLPPEILLEKSNITLYSLDLATSEAIFVETPNNIDVCGEPFMYYAQYRHSEWVYTVSFKDMMELAKHIELQPKKMVFINSVGRCGSTLAGQVFKQIKGVRIFSEPEALTWLVRARLNKIETNINLIALFDACIRMICKASTQQSVVIKGRSFSVELLDWIKLLYQSARHFFLYRDAETWLKSSVQAFVTDSPEVSREAQAERLMWNLAPLVPLIKERMKFNKLNVIEIFSLMWLSAMDKFERTYDETMSVLSIPYVNWHTTPYQTVSAMLEYCKFTIDNELLNLVLNRDSQLGTELSQSTLSNKVKNLSNSDINQLHAVLETHPLINTSNFEASCTLKI